MTLAQPWWLLLALLVLLLLYLHRQRRAARAALVGGMHLWRRVAVQHSPQAKPLPRFTPALALQLLVLLLVALALSRPTFKAGQTGGTLILLESSRAMQAGDVTPSRFQAALGQAGAAMRGPVTLVEVGETPWPLAVERRDLAAVKGALGSLRAADGVADWDAAARYVRSLLKGRTGLQVIAYPSAGNAGAARQALSGLQPTILPLGGSAMNAATTSLTVEPGLAEAPWTLRGSVRAFGSAGTRELSVSLGGQVLKTLPLSLRDGQDTPFTLKFRPGAGGVLQVSLSRPALATADVLSGDDRAQLVLTPTPTPLRVTLVANTTPNPDDPVERSLRALPGAQVTRLTALPDPPPDPLPDTDLLVVTHPGVPVSGVSAAPVTLWLNASTQTRSDAALAWNEAAPLSEGVTWADLRVNASAQAQGEAKAGAKGGDSRTALLSGLHGPLIEVLTEAERSGQKTGVLVHFSLTDSNWATLPAFPVFMKNLATLAQPRAGRQVSACTVGLPCPLPAGRLKLEGPGVKLDQPGASFVPKWAGVYQLDGAPIAVNRFAGLEADLRVGAQPVPPSARAAPFPMLTQLLGLWRPLLTLALLALLLELLLHYRAEPGLRRGRWNAFPSAVRRMLALHALAALLMLLAVLNIPLPGRGKAAWTARLLPPGDAPPAERVDFTLWGGPLPSLQPLTAQTKQTQASPTPPSGDLALALATLAAARPAERAGSVTVSGADWLTSGLWPQVQAELLAGDLRVKMADAPSPHLHLLGLSVPSGVSVGQAFTAQISLFSPAAETAELTLRRGDTELLRQRVNLRAGLNRLSLPLRETVAGEAGYTLTLKAAGQAVSAQAATRVQDDGGVLLVSADSGAAQAVSQALRIQGVPSRTVTPDTLNAAALSPEGLRGLERLALLNVPARALSPDTRAALDELVRGGAHLYLGGGSSAFGPGGYVGTALETLSPLSGRVTRDVPRLGLALVVDKSGSMNELVGQGFTKLDLIKTAALNSALLLSPQSDVTVIAFDSAPKVAVPLTQATPAYQAQIRSQIARIEAEGGTVVKRALDAALKELSRSGAAQRHMILLTDGIDGGIFSPDEYERQIRRIHATGITVSTVSVGAGMHIPLMRDIARWGGGQFSLTQDWRDVPALLAQDTLNQGQSAVKTGRYAARWGEGTAAQSGSHLSGPTQSVPNINGYVQTTLKPGATLLARVGTGKVGAGKDSDPLAATWRVGLGSVSALATQTAGGWTGTLGAQTTYPALLAPLLRGVSRQAEDNLLSVERRGSDVLVTSAQPQVKLTSPERRILTLVPDGSGRYVTRLYAAPGGLVLNAAGAVRAVGTSAGSPQATRVTLGQLARASAEKGAGHSLTWSGGWPTFALLSLLSFLLGLGIRYLPEQRHKRGQEPR